MVSWIAPSQLASQSCNVAVTRSENDNNVPSSRPSRTHSQSFWNGSPNLASLAESFKGHGPSDISPDTDSGRREGGRQCDDMGR
eukprot:2500825-Rhodomonas_salina.1